MNYRNILICRSCSSDDKNMHYSKELNEWFCLECAGEDLEDWIEAEKNT